MVFVEKNDNSFMLDYVDIRRFIGWMQQQKGDAGQQRTKRRGNDRCCQCGSIFDTGCGKAKRIYDSSWRLVYR